MIKPSLIPKASGIVARANGFKLSKLINQNVINKISLFSVLFIYHDSYDHQQDFFLIIGSSKGNQGEFHDDIRLFLETQINDSFSDYPHDVFTEVNGDHGRIETRRVWLTHTVDWLIDRHPRWTSLKGIVVIESTREIGDKTTYERRYYITSHHDKKAAFIAHAIRSHSHIENKLQIRCQF